MRSFSRRILEMRGVSISYFLADRLFAGTGAVLCVVLIPASSRVQHQCCSLNESPSGHGRHATAVTLGVTSLFDSESSPASKPNPEREREASFSPALVLHPNLNPTFNPNPTSSSEMNHDPEREKEARFMLLPLRFSRV